MGHMGAQWVGGGSGGRGLTRACVGRPAPWWCAWWSAACAFCGAAEPRRRLGRTHRGRWGGAVRWPGAGALGGGRPCAALASDGGGVPAGCVVSLRAVAPRRWAAALPRPLGCAQAERDMASMHHARACAPCAPRAYPRRARASGLRSVCPRCACLRVRIVCTVHSCSLSLTCACLSP